MLTERKHIVLLGTVAVLAFPAVASAASHEGLATRVRLRADAPNATAPRGTASGSIGLGDAVALSGPLLDPVDRYSRLIAATATRTERRRKIHARDHREAKDARKEEEKFAQLPGGVTMATLESIAACESGGNPEAVSPEGTYRGLFQFDQGTWESVGGHGDPAVAPESRTGLPRRAPLFGVRLQPLARLRLTAGAAQRTAVDLRTTATGGDPTTIRA